MSSKLAMQSGRALLTAQPRMHNAARRSPAPAAFVEHTLPWLARGAAAANQPLRHRPVAAAALSSQAASSSAASSLPSALGTHVQQPTTVAWQPEPPSLAVLVEAPEVPLQDVPPSVDAVFRNECGAWRVRPYDNSDYKDIVSIQTDSFHEPSPIKLIDDLAYRNFKAEVVDALRQKLSFGSPETFQMLVAEELPEPAAPAAAGELMHGQRQHLQAVGEATEAGTPGLDPEPRGRVVGVVEVSVHDLRHVLQHLPAGLQDYVYISSMAVHPQYRRRGVAHALLQAADLMAARWRQPHMALHVHQDNTAAVQLYEAYGFSKLAEDPAWKGMLGVRRQQLMYRFLGTFDQSDSA